jgi:hypothetical protein
MAALLWMTRLWPIALPALVLAFAPRPRGIEFLVFGGLACFGVQSVVGAVSIELPTAFPDAASLPEKVFAIMLAHMLRMLVISVFLSVPALLWLRQLLQSPATRGSRA